MSTAPTLGYFRFDPCRNCCSGCMLCENGIWPQELQVTLSGVADAGCKNCGSLNGTYVVSRSVQYPQHCIWALSPILPNAEWDCAADPFQRITSLWVMLSRDDDPHNLQLIVWFRSDYVWPFAGPWIVYSLSLGDVYPDCRQFSGEVVPYVSKYEGDHALSCDPTQSICTVTSLQAQ
jgi:hypothetical protein